MVLPKSWPEFAQILAKLSFFPNDHTGKIWVEWGGGDNFELFALDPKPCLHAGLLITNFTL